MDSRSKWVQIRQVPCKRKANPLQFRCGSIWTRSRVNGALKFWLCTKIRVYNVSSLTLHQVWLGCCMDIYLYHIFESLQLQGTLAAKLDKRNLKGMLTEKLFWLHFPLFGSMFDLVYLLHFVQTNDVIFYITTRFKIHLTKKIQFQFKLLLDEKQKT